MREVVGVSAFLFSTKSDFETLKKLASISILSIRG
ncbi:Uncharacterised protein [Streptococcus pneumoniae]|nr:Uncharacterised protein [Streptococcus pneumoniae]